MKCIVEGCERQAHTRKMCQKHYARWRKWGDPTKKKSRPAAVSPGECFGRLTVIEESSGRKGTQRVFRCLCECGKDVEVASGSLRSGNTRSCGCLQRDRSVESNHKDDAIGYFAVHTRLTKQRGKASEHTCVDCSKQALHWSYKGREGFSTNLADYEPRCASCHQEYDQLP